MTQDELSTAIKNVASPRLQCRPAPREGVLVRTPFLYPDGDIVEVCVIERDGRFAVTDHSEALGWLGMQSVSGNLSPNQLRLVDDVCQTLGVELNGGRLVLRCNDALELGKAIHMVGQAVVRVSDVWSAIPSSDKPMRYCPQWPVPKPSGSVRLWPWYVLYAFCGLGVTATFYFGPEGMPSILQIFGVIITIPSFWASITVRTSQTKHTSQWLNMFDMASTIGSMLIITGIYFGAVTALSPELVAGLGMLVIVAWGVVMVVLARTAR